MTAEAAPVWNFLADVRRRRRRGRRGRIAYAVYVAALLLAVYGGPLVVRAVRSVEGTPHPTSATVRIAAALPVGMSALWLLVLLGLTRQATWRGPVLLSAADADWMLSTPLPRSRLLRPRFIASVLTGLLLSALLGFVLALVLHGYGVASLGRIWFPIVAAAMVTVTIATSVGALVERFDRAKRVVSIWSPAAAGVVVVFMAVAVARAAGANLRWLQAVILWSGPWGWCSQLAAQAFDGRDTSWPVAAGLTVAVTVALLPFALSAAPAIPARALRQRAAMSAAVSAALFLGETRDAHLGIRAARGGPATRRRLPMPRRAWLAIPWRDATSLVRSPAGIGWMTLCLAVMAVALRDAAGQPSARHTIVPIGIAMVAGYAAAGQLVEPARLDADDPRRTRWSPYPAARQAQRHAAVPLLTLYAVGLAAGLVATPWLTGRQTILTLAAVILVMPVVVAASLIGSYRGRVPLEYMLGGVDIGFGPTGPLLLILWYLYGPFAAVASGQLMLAPLVKAWPTHTGIAAPLIGAHVLAVVFNAVLFWWAGLRARDLSRQGLGD
jgi:hypothetical protein